MQSVQSLVGFEEVSSNEMSQVNGGALPIIGRILVRVAAKAIVWGLDKIFND